MNIQFQDSDGNQVAALLTEPERKQDRLVILCHGFLTSKQSNTNRRLTELLLPHGISTFCFDWFGMGESEGDFSDITVSRCCDQLEQAIAFIERLGYTRVGLIGSSFGGMISLLLASRHPHLLAMGLKCPAPDLPEVFRMQFGESGIDHWKKTGKLVYATEGENKTTLRYDFFSDCLTYDAFRTSQHITIPTRIVHGDRDELVPLQHIQRLERSLSGNTDVCILKGANHYFGRPEDFRKMTTLLENWMVQFLTKE